MEGAEEMAACRLSSALVDARARVFTADRLGIVIIVVCPFICPHSNPNGIEADTTSIGMSLARALELVCVFSVSFKTARHTVFICIN